MHNHHNRTVKINKQQLIDKIKENKVIHIKEFEEAKTAYAVEATKQIKNIKKELEAGSLNVKLQLITPIDRSLEYDKVVQMFEWELEEQVELTQDEFNEYINDENVSSRSAKLANSFYSKSL